VRRFLEEAQLLARLRHPAIVAGRRVFRFLDTYVLEMELVAGRTLEESLAEGHAFPEEQALDVVVQVAQALEYLAAQGVVHRDLKPGNILVTADGQVRLLDFGIAKLLVDGAAKETELTEMGGRALTPQYAAPEQLLGQPIGTSADIYALGVVLYELLAETLPYRLKRDTRGELEQAILEGHLVPPSQQAATAWKGRLKGDLDTIVLKALKQRPEERYATAAAFGEDIARYLKGEPVLAQPDSAGYRAKKFLARHRLGVAAAALVVVALATGLGVALWQAQVAREHAETARKEARTAQAVKEFMQGIFLANTAQQGDPVKARQTTARELLDIGAARIDESLNDAPEAKLEMLQIFTELYSQLLLNDKAIDFAERQVALVRRTAGEHSLALAEALFPYALTVRARSMDDPRQGEAIRESKAILARLGAGSSWHLSVALAIEGEFLADRDFPRALEVARHSMALEVPMEDRNRSAISAGRVELLAGNAAAARAHTLVGLAANAAIAAKGAAGEGGFLHQPALLEILGSAEWALGNGKAAEEHLREALAAARQTFGDDDPDTARLQARLASFLSSTGREDEARGLVARGVATLGPTRPDDRSKLRYEALTALGTAQTDLGQFREGLASLTAALAMRDPGLDASPAIAGVLRDQARALAGLGRRDEARQVLARAVAMREKAGISPPAVLQEEAELSRRLAAPGSR